MVESYITRAKNMEIKNIRKAVIPAAGLGKRMRPISNIIPKELLPVGTKPLIQYAVEDLLHSGIKHIFIVISKRKSSIKKYFEEVFRPTVSKIYFGYQKYPTGVPDAIYTARNFVGKEDFLLVMPDVIVERGFSKKFLSKVQRLRLDLCKYIGIGAYIKVSTSKLKYINYGGREVFKKISNEVLEITRFKAKTKQHHGLRGAGRTILSHRIFTHLKRHSQRRGKEYTDLQFYDELINIGERFLGVVMEGELWDVGCPLGFLMTNKEFLKAVYRRRDFYGYEIGTFWRFTG
jgi:UTP--glucose-1-phosphate uridylyltransferase